MIEKLLEHDTEILLHDYSSKKVSDLTIHDKLFSVIPNDVVTISNINVSNRNVYKIDNIYYANESSIPLIYMENDSSVYVKKTIRELRRCNRSKKQLFMYRIPLLSHFEYINFPLNPYSYGYTLIWTDSLIDRRIKSMKIFNYMKLHGAIQSLNYPNLYLPDNESIFDIDSKTDSMLTSSYLNSDYTRQPIKDIHKYEPTVLIGILSGLFDFAGDSSTEEDCVRLRLHNQDLYEMIVTICNILGLDYKIQKNITNAYFFDHTSQYVDYCMDIYDHDIPSLIEERKIYHPLFEDKRLIPFNPFYGLCKNEVIADDINPTKISKIYKIKIDRESILTKNHIVL